MGTTIDTPVIHTNFLATQPADATLILRAISPLTLAALGARHFVNLGDGIHFDVGRGTRTKIVIKLQASDLFAVESVKIGRDFEGTSTGFFTDVPVESLDMVLRGMAGL